MHALLCHGIPYLMHTLNGKDGLCHVELSRTLCEYVLLHEEGHEVAANTELHHQIQVQVILERIIQLHHPALHTQHSQQYIDSNT